MKPPPQTSCLLALVGSLFQAATLHAADWPQWRGPHRDDHAADNPAITSLPPEPKVVWRLNIGSGFSSPVVAGGKLAYLDAQNEKEVAHLVDAATGKEFWQLPFAEAVGDELGTGPRSTPFFDGDRVYFQSCTGEFRCLNVADGKVIWGTSFERDFGVKYLGGKANEGIAARRGNNGCGVIEGERVILPVGGTTGASLVCFNKLDGRKLWSSQNDQAAYSSIMVATLAGVRQVVAFTAEGLLGLELETGRLLWRVPLVTNAKRHAATPIINGDTVTVNSHTFGLVCIQITKAEGGLKAAQLWLNPDLKINVTTPVLAGNYLYGLGAKKDYVCVDAATGKIMWQQPGFGEVADSSIVIGGNLLVQSENGILHLIAADPAKFTELGQAQVCGKTWNHPAYADGKLWVREGLTSGFRLTCFDLLAR